MKLRMRMIVLYSVLTLLIISIMSIGFYFPTVDLLKSKQSVEMNDSINSLDKIINIRITNINQSFLGMFEDDYFKKLVARSRDRESGNIDDAMLESEFRDYFSRYVSIDSDILESIMLVTSDGKIFSDKYKPQYSYFDFINSKYANSAMLNKNKLRIVNNSLQDKYIAFVRSFYYEGGGLSGSYVPGVGSLNT